MPWANFLLAYSSEKFKRTDDGHLLYFLDVTSAMFFLGLVAGQSYRGMNVA